VQTQQLQQLTDILGETLVMNTGRKLAQIEAARCSRRIARLEAELRSYETRFAMLSAEAWKHYQAGTLGDDFDVMEWRMLFENLKALQHYHRRLTGIQGS
jgi:hypothetical protein